MFAKSCNIESMEIICKRDGSENARDEGCGHFMSGNGRTQWMCGRWLPKILQFHETGNIRQTLHLRAKSRESSSNRRASKIKNVRSTLINFGVQERAHERGVVGTRGLDADAVHI